VLASATADDTGSFTATGRAPQSYYGPRIFLGTGQTSGLLGAANFSTNARLILTPDSGPPGTDVTAQAVGSGSFETVKFVWNATNATLGAKAANVNGTLSGAGSFHFTVPAGAAPGRYFGQRQRQAYGSYRLSHFHGGVRQAAACYAASGFRRR